MNFSRSLALTKVAGILHRGLLLKKNPVGLAVKQQIRQAGHTEFYYRRVPKSSPYAYRIAVALNSFMWWWILWHCFTEYDEIIGFHIPDPEKWTDEELGIPK